LPVCKFHYGYLYTFCTAQPKTAAEQTLLVFIRHKERKEHKEWVFFLMMHAVAAFAAFAFFAAKNLNPPATLRLKERTHH